MKKIISQREAHRNKKDLQRMVEQNLQRLQQWRSTVPGGIHIAAVNVQEVSAVALKTASRLGYAIIAKVDGATINFLAVEP